MKSNRQADLQAFLLHPVAPGGTDVLGDEILIGAAFTQILQRSAARTETGGAGRGGEGRSVWPPRETEGAEATGKHQAEAARAKPERQSAADGALKRLSSGWRAAATAERWLPSTRLLLLYCVSCFFFFLHIDCSGPWSLSLLFPPCTSLASAVLFARITRRIEDGRNKQTLVHAQRRGAIDGRT